MLCSLVRQQVVVLRGLNLPIDGKTPDFMPLTNLTTLKTLQPLGTAVARVLFIWEAFEPQQGQYNAEYLAYYKGIVQVTIAELLLQHARIHQSRLHSLQGRLKWQHMYMHVPSDQESVYSPSRPCTSWTS